MERSTFGVRADLHLLREKNGWFVVTDDRCSLERPGDNLVSLILGVILSPGLEIVESNMKRNVTTLLAAFLMLTAAISSAATKTERFRIKVLTSESQILAGDPDAVPKDCDGINYNGYCHQSKFLSKQNTMRVQDETGKSFAITCLQDSRFSKCVPLTIGQSFDARRDKRGITIFYEDANGGASKQLYTVVEPAQAPASATASASPHGSPAPVANAVSPVQIPAPATGEALREKVKCNFSSTPPGAEITLDGRYVGSTPSTVGLSTGTHVVVLLMPGFAPWKRELTVSSGSELNVNAALQKTPE